MTSDFCKLIIELSRASISARGDVDISDTGPMGGTGNMGTFNCPGESYVREVAGIAGLDDEEGMGVDGRIVEATIFSIQVAARPTIQQLDK